MSGCGPGTRVVSTTAFQLNGNDATDTTEADAMDEETTVGASDDEPTGDTAALRGDEATDGCTTPPCVAHPPNAATMITALGQARDTLTRVRRTPRDNGCAFCRANTVPRVTSLGSARRQLE